MKQLCIPLTGIPDKGVAEVTVRSGESNNILRFRLEKIMLEQGEGVEDQIHKLRSEIQHHDPAWELIEICDNAHEQSCVHVLYREKISTNQ